MTEPKRLLDGDATDFEQALLRSVLDETPSAAQSLRMMQGVSSGGGLSWLTGVVSHFAAKGVIGVVLLGLAATAAYLPKDSDAAHSGQEQTSASATAPEVVRTELALTPAPDGLGAEVRLLDRVRTALRTDSDSEAANALRDYRKRFPNGILNTEAKLLNQKLEAHKRLTSF